MTKKIWTHGVQSWKGGHKWDIQPFSFKYHNYVQSSSVRYQSYVQSSKSKHHRFNNFFIFCVQKYFWNFTKRHLYLKKFGGCKESLGWCIYKSHIKLVYSFNQMTTKFFFIDFISFIILTFHISQARDKRASWKLFNLSSSCQINKKDSPSIWKQQQRTTLYLLLCNCGCFKCNDFTFAFM